MDQLKKVLRKDYRYRRHAAGLNYQQERPPVKKSDHRMISIAQIGVLTSDELRLARGQFGINKSAGHRHESAKQPAAKNQRSRVDAAGYNIGIFEYTSADDSAHHDHRRTKRAQLAG